MLISVRESKGHNPLPGANAIAHLNHAVG